MPYFSGAEAQFQAHITKQVFVAPGDYNYVNARFCRAVGLHQEFFWQCLQALEKYLKAGLVLNGVPVKALSHDLLELFRLHQEAYGEVAVKEIVKPEVLNPELWRAVTLEAYLRKVNSLGQPDARYGAIGYHNKPSDLFALDVLCFELRRRTVCLEWVVGTDWKLEEDQVDEYGVGVGLKLGRFLLDFPKYQSRPLSIPQISFRDIGDNFDDAFYNWNIPFSREEAYLSKPAPRRVSASFGGFGNSFLFMLYNAAERDRADETRRAAIRARMEWIFSNIKVSREVKGHFRALYE